MHLSKMSSLKTPAKRPPLAPRAMDTPAKRETHQTLAPRRRLFTSNAPSAFTPHRTTGGDTLFTPHRATHHEPHQECDGPDSPPMRLSSLASPNMTPSRRIGGKQRHVDDTLSEELLKTLFKREFIAIYTLMYFTDRQHRPRDRSYDAWPCYCF